MGQENVRSISDEAREKVRLMKLRFTAETQTRVKAVEKAQAKAKADEEAQEPRTFSEALRAAAAQETPLSRACQRAAEAMQQ